MDDNTDKTIVADLCATPRFKPGELPRCATALTDEWMGYEPLTLNGKEQEAAIYLGHLRPVSGVSKNPRPGTWSVTHSLQRAIEHNPELIVMAARMKKLLTD